MMDELIDEFRNANMPNCVHITTSCCQINCGGQGDIAINVQHTKPPKINHDLVANVGYGKITPLQVVRRFAPRQPAEEGQASIFNKLVGRVVRKKKLKSGVLVRGVDDILIKFGKCCQPVPGDPIIGYITQGYGVTIHRTTCINALRVNPERQIEVEWNQQIAETYPVKIRIVSHDRMGLLADVVGSISKYGANILNATSETSENKMVDSFFTIGVEDVSHLEKILSAVKKIKLVQEVKRVG
jgi:GTP pyrophosphokinase